MGNSPIISVIIPVYNVGLWIRECLDSIKNQTFIDFEVILVDDGSTDDSGVICDEYAAEDNRFKVIHKCNEGTSKARNMGIKDAKGEYLAFIDADDWIDKEYLGKLYFAAIEQNADMSECDIWRYDDKTKEKTLRISSGAAGKDYSIKERIVYGNTAIWKCLFKKSLFVKHNIEFPDCHSEPRAVYGLLIALSNKVVNVKEPLYFYRRFREGSLSQKPRQRNGDELAVGIQAYSYLIDGFKRCGLYERYKEELQKTVINKLSDILAANFYRKPDKEYRVMAGSYQDYIRKIFPQALCTRYITLGGYNLNRIVWKMNCLHNPYGRFNFSSIISIMNPTAVSIEHKNPYRKIMLERDITSAFWQILKEENPKFMIIDFLEERFDIIKKGNGYITKSDAWDSAEVQENGFQVIKRDSEQCEQLWKDNCIAFVMGLKMCFEEKQVILVKNYLSEKVGDIQTQEYFGEIEYIRNTNKILERYYDFFEGCCSGATVVETKTYPYYFTDKEFEYGAVPSHLNELVNEEVAREIEDYLRNSGAVAP